jgi:hypothetical protein
MMSLGLWFLFMFFFTRRSPFGYERWTFGEIIYEGRFFWQHLLVANRRRYNESVTYHAFTFSQTHEGETVVITDELCLSPPQFMLEYVDVYGGTSDLRMSSHAICQ